MSGWGRLWEVISVSMRLDEIMIGWKILSLVGFCKINIECYGMLSIQVLVVSLLSGAASESWRRPCLFIIIIIHSVNIKPPRCHFGPSLCLGSAILLLLLKCNPSNLTQINRGIMIQLNQTFSSGLITKFLCLYLAVHTMQSCNGIFSKNSIPQIPYKFIFPHNIFL